MIDSLLSVSGAAFAPGNLAWIAFGVALGYLVSALPGLGKGTATAVAIPLTFYLAPLAAIAFLVGIAKGSTAGSAVSAILLNTRASVRRRRRPWPAIRWRAPAKRRKP